jgi:hypothetical protein
VRGEKDVASTHITFAHHGIGEGHGRRTHKGRDKGIGRGAVDVEWSRELLKPPGLEHGDAVGHGHGLRLIVGDVEGGGAEALEQGAQLRPHLEAQHGIEVGQGLIEQEGLRLAHQGTTQRHALALAARERAWVAVEVGGQVEHLGGSRHPGGDLGPR